MRYNSFLGLTAAFLALTMPAYAAPADCANLPDYTTLKTALTEARKTDNGGLNLDMWATIVDRSGVVCAVAFSGEAVGDQWPGSRIISAQKANTANAFSLKGLALSTANLYSAVQPGGSLFGLQESNPVNINVAYKGSAKSFGAENDPLVGERIGGINVFGGGLALYNRDGDIIGGLGVSGDTSCADHNIAWKTRKALELDYVPAGVAKDNSDTIIFDLKNGRSASGFGHPVCGGKEESVARSLEKVRVIEAKIEEPVSDNSKAEPKADEKKK